MSLKVPPFVAVPRFSSDKVSDLCVAYSYGGIIFAPFDLIFILLSAKIKVLYTRRSG